MRFWVFLCFAAIVTLSLIPTAVKFHLGTTGAYHNWGHFGIFLFTALLLFWTAGTFRSKAARLAALLALAGFVEYAESVVYNNPIEWHDIFIDSLGALAGLVLISLRSFWTSTERTPSDT